MTLFQDIDTSSILMRTRTHSSYMISALASSLSNLSSERKTMTPWSLMKKMRFPTFTSS